MAKLRRLLFLLRAKVAGLCLEGRAPVALSPGGGRGLSTPGRSVASGRPGFNGAGEGVGEGFGGSPEPMLTCSAAQTRDFVPRVSRETCIARQHRRQTRALSYYACSSCLARQASPFWRGLSCCAGFWTGDRGNANRQGRTNKGAPPEARPYLQLHLLLEHAVAGRRDRHRHVAVLGAGDLELGRS